MKRTDMLFQTVLRSPPRAGIFQLSKKLMAIRLRWLVIICCSLMLLYSRDSSLSRPAAYGFSLLYILSNVVLYRLDEGIFESSYFYAPLVLMDTLCATTALMVSGQVATEFYLVYFAIIFLCAIFQDFLGLIVVTGLCITVYAVLLFQAGTPSDPGSYLPLPFLFVAALFYGYFAHIAQGEKSSQLQAQIDRIIGERLAEGERLKSEFIRNTTHELRTPLTTIMGYSELLTEGAFGPLTEKQGGAVARVMESARGLLQIVEQILDLSKLDRGEVSAAIHRREVKGLIHQLRLDLAPLESAKPYKIRYEVEDDIPPLETDWEKLKKVLCNILGNAVKFTERGEVKLSVKKKSDEELSFAVSDTGIGIPREKLPLVFERFRQLDGSQSRCYGGTGLGMAVSKNLVDFLGGRIEVESEVGKGSTFRVSIPLAARRERSAAGLRAA